jgi:hypothetical protein
MRGQQKLFFDSYFSFLQDLLGKSDPYLVISKQLPDGTKVVVHKTEVHVYIN